MKYLKSLKLFLEDFNINDTDGPDIVAQKKDLNLLLKHITDYNSGKSKIDNIILNSKDKTPEEITKKVNDVIEQDGSRNTFLSNQN